MVLGHESKTDIINVNIDIQGASTLDVLVMQLGNAPTLLDHPVVAKEKTFDLSILSFGFATYS